MIELNFVMKIKSINLGCYFGHPLYRDAESRRFWTSPEPAPAPVQNVYRVFFSKDGLVASSGARDINFFYESRSSS